MGILNKPFTHAGFHSPQRSDSAEDPPAAVVDDDDVKSNIARELRHDPRRIRVIDRGEIADDAPIVCTLAPSEESRELAVDAVRPAIRPDGEVARLARGDEIPLSNRKAVAKVDARAAGDLMRERTQH